MHVLTRAQALPAASARRRSYGRWFLPLLLLTSQVSCRQEHGRQSSPSGSSDLSVFVSIPPQAFLVERVGGAHVGVNVLLDSGQSPHSFEPTPVQMSKLARSRLYFSIGIPFERRVVARIAGLSSGPRVVSTVEGIPLRRMECDDEHAEDSPHAHAAGELDPHVWLNPRYAKLQAQLIRDALAEADPIHARDYSSNLVEVQRELDALDARLAAMLAPHAGQGVCVFHPAYGYFTDAYGLRQLPVEIEGKSPSARQIARLIDRARSDRIRILFVQPQFSRLAARVIADEIGAVVAPLDPLARDYIRNLDRMGAAVSRALGASE